MEEIQDFFNHQTKKTGRKRTQTKEQINLNENLIIDPFYFPPENEKGNIEYKLKLCNPNKNRFEHLLTQMKWRMGEGN